MFDVKTGMFVPHGMSIENTNKLYKKAILKNSTDLHRADDWIHLSSAGLMTSFKFTHAQLKNFVKYLFESTKMERGKETSHNVDGDFAVSVVSYDNEDRVEVIFTSDSSISILFITHSILESLAHYLNYVCVYEELIR
jgi:hypothetical protein